jgi:hypothetical protein
MKLLFDRRRLVRSGSTSSRSQLGTQEAQIPCAHDRIINTFRKKFAERGTRSPHKLLRAVVARLPGREALGPR